MHLWFLLFFAVEMNVFYNKNIPDMEDIMHTYK